ncbi:unnamed protein product [Rotaria sp. Silwood1]|nr:unnamed protein product [Rotaria sp. Silwood1]CAF1666657.1 unnamed protein product [Rotaria sp. Silwood1]CAF3755190.1 unnamed protein product [Rotaria sp. Silwood1]CAF3813880.1 unnamed protein product [Rotaria sp. Silwood1]CAF3821280.1 unnamed protein product [Rotaria sp. Silwood1]
MDLFVDDNQTVIIADYENQRIIQWRMNDTNGQIVAGGHGSGNLLEQLTNPVQVFLEKDINSLIICEWGNRRVVRWSRSSATTQGELLINNVQCRGLTMDDQRNLYISEYQKHEVRRYQVEQKTLTVVAGGNGPGAGLNQLNSPRYLFVDRQQSIYVSDTDNDRVMKWSKGAKEGIVVAGGKGQGASLTQLSRPRGLFIDTYGTVYVVDSLNHRVVRWVQGAKQGTVIVGGNGTGEGANQLSYPEGLSFDHHGNLYVADQFNHRVQLFTIE